MAVIETWLRQDLNRLVSVQSLQGQVFSLDNSGNLIGVRVTKDGEPVSLAGTVTGYCILSDGQTVNVTGSGNAGIQNGNEAYIVLPQLVYSVPGQISIVIKLTSGSAITTLAACTGYVYRSRTSNEVVPSGTPIPDLATLEEAIRNANTAASSANSAASSANTAATAAENVNVAMSKSGKVITITATNRIGTSTSHTVTEPTLTVERTDNVVTVTATDADGETSIEFDAVDADEVAELKEAVSTKAEEDGYYEELAAGTADQLVSTEAVTDTTPYLYRKSGGSVDIGDRETLEKIVGGTVGWNQLYNPANISTVTQSGITFTKNSDGTITVTGTATEETSIQLVGGMAVTAEHKMLIQGCPSGGAYEKYYIGSPPKQDYGSGMIVENTTTTRYVWISVKSGVEITNPLVFKPQIYDLTAMFGSTIADYIYSLEQAAPGAGVAWFRKLFPKDYYPYNAGELISVKPSSHDMVGFNAFDKSKAVTGQRFMPTGTGNVANTYTRSDYTRCVSGALYYFKNVVTTASGYSAVFWYDAQKNYISSDSLRDMTHTSGNLSATAPQNAYYMGINMLTAEVDVCCINLANNGSRNGEYEPYEKHSYPLADVELRGPIAIDADGKLVYSGDEYTPDGQVKRKYGLVNLGTLNWRYYDYEGHKRFGVNFVAKNDSSNLICPRYEAVGYTAVFNNTKVGIAVHTDGTQLVVYDPSFNDAATLKTAMNGVYLLYELATPTEETAEPYNEVQVVDDWGTEEFVDTREVAIPVGHSTSYMANLRDKLQHLPSLTEEDGEYIVKQIGSQMSLAPFKAGTYPDMHVGVADQLLSKQSVEDQVPYGFRQSGGGLAIGDREEDMVVGGTIVWNQLVPDSISHVTMETAIGWNAFVGGYFYLPLILNHKYIIALNGKTVAGGAIGIRDIDNNIVYRPAIPSYALAYSAPLTTNGTTFIQGNWAEGTTDAYLVAYDLTAMFGFTIADAVYAMEQATPGAGVAWFRKLFPKDYYEYNAGELISCSGLSEHKMVGFNQWDEEWELGNLNGATGENKAATNSIRSKNYVPVVGGKTYLINIDFTVCCGYDANKNFISTIPWRYATPSGCYYLDVPIGVAYVRFGIVASYGTTYNNDICINFSDPSRNGEYEPYHESSYSLDSSLTLRGVPKLDANNKLYYDGDTYAGDGTVTRRYGVVDLGTLSIKLHETNLFSILIPNIKEHSDDTGGYEGRRKGVICSKYSADTQISISSGVMTDKTWLRTTNNLYIKDTAYTDASSFKAAMSGVMLVYELAEPTTDQVEPYQSVQQVDPYGTEEYTHSGDADVYVPVGHVTKYPTDLRSKIENAPDAPDDNGDYIVRKTAEGVSYVPLTQAKEIPAPPSANGTYRLTVTVTNDTPTYSWVSA